MYQQKIGISVGNDYEIPTTEVVKLLKKIGFDAISPEWEENVDLTEVVETARACGLTVQSLHAPIGEVGAMWCADEAIADEDREIFRSLEDCHRLNIPILVAHAWFGFGGPITGADRSCFRKFDKLTEKAERYGIQIAFENTEGEEYLSSLMDHYRNNPTVGFCWDSGHEMCYNHCQDMLEKFGDRLLITHLNDNLGISRFDGEITWLDDLHLLPYDGIGDWDDNVCRLQKSRKIDILNFELSIRSKPGRHENDAYGQMGLEAYFTEAYKRACKVAYRYVK